jgi:TonB family protein
MRRPSLQGLALWISVNSILAVQVHAQQPSPTAATIAYPNNSEGLRQLLNNMLLAARREDESELQSMIRETEIPNYEIWFTKNFGQEKGESWAGPYGRWLAKDEREFQELMVKLAHMDGEFIVEKMDTAKRYDLLNGPLDGYIASWKLPTAPKGKELVTLADFFFIEGKFRCDSTAHYFPFQPPSKHSFIPAKVVKKVQPEYPGEARQNNIQGTVKIQVIIQKDGSVTVQNVVEGDPILAPAAIEAVKQWRYEPTLFDGKPVDIQTTIEVNFTLRP